MRNIRSYFKAWELRQKGTKLREIAEIMGYKTAETPRRMIAYMEVGITHLTSPILKKRFKILRKQGQVYNNFRKAYNKLNLIRAT